MDHQGHQDLIHLPEGGEGIVVVADILATPFSRWIFKETQLDRHPSALVSAFVLEEDLLLVRSAHIIAFLFSLNLFSFC